MDQQQPTKPAFERAVEEAARQGAARIAALQLRRVAIASFLCGMVVAAAIAVAAVLISESTNRTFARQNAVYDCSLFKSVATVMGNFVQSDATLRKQQNQAGLSQSIAKDIEKIIPRSDLEKLANANEGSAAAVVLLWNKEANKLKKIGSVDCTAHLGG